jgi:hypothetical protein
MSTSIMLFVVISLSSSLVGKVQAGITPYPTPNPAQDYSLRSQNMILDDGIEIENITTYLDILIAKRTGEHSGVSKDL